MAEKSMWLPAGLRGNSRPVVRWLVCVAAATACAVPARAQTCAGDCNDDGRVFINELVVGVTIALGQANVATCPAMDGNDDGAVRIDELVTAVRNALSDCPRRPTPT